MTHRGRRALVPLLALSAFFCLAASPRPAVAAESTPHFAVEMLNAEGLPETRAGAHPDLLRIDFDAGGEGASLRDLEIGLPPGLGGSPNAVPLCPRAIYENEGECAAESQVGRIVVPLFGAKTTLPLYLAEPGPGEVVKIVSRTSVSLPLTAEISPEDFGVTLVGHELQEGLLSEVELELWGVPADHQEGTAIPRRPFLTTPVACGPATFEFRARPWGEGAQWTDIDAEAGPLTGCEELPFEPELGFTLSEPRADAPSGMRIDLSFPAEAEGSELGPADLAGAVIALPSGMTISPGGFAGLEACTDAQLGLGDSDPAHCPDRSKIGSAEFVSEALGEPLRGTLYLAEEHPGERTRSFLVIPGPEGTLKFVSTMQVDPSTGRLTTHIKDLPPLPIQRIELEFDGGPRALFATPLSCGRVSAGATFHPIGGGPAVVSAAPVTIGSAVAGTPCAPPPFSPRLSVRDSNLRAGAPTAIATVLERQAGEQLPRSFSTTMPAGISAGIGALTLCSGDAAARASCPAGSRIGTATAAIGSGPNPAVLNGDAYLTGPYGRAPYGLLMRFSGRLGPIDLGTIATRSTLQMNPRNGEMTVSTTGIAGQTEGLQVRFERIEFDMNRPGFLRNPTACTPSRSSAVLESQSGALATSSSLLKMHGCRRLGFKPRIRILLSGRGQLRKHGSPTLRILTRMRPGDAGMRTMKLVLPAALKMGTGDLGEICSLPDAESGSCPADSSVGSAVSRTPLLATPLRGSVYMAQPHGDGPPDLLVDLSGSGFGMAVRSHSARLRGGRLVTRISGLPDTPLSTFSMRLGGSLGTVVLRHSPCGPGRPTALTAQAWLGAQNGRRRAYKLPIELKGRCPVPSG